MPDFAQGANRAHGRDIVKGEEGGEHGLVKPTTSWWPCIRVGGWRIAFELRDQARIDAQAKLLRDTFDVRPAHFSVGAELLSLDEGDLAVAEVK